MHVDVTILLCIRIRNMIVRLNSLTMVAMELARETVTNEYDLEMKINSPLRVTTAKRFLSFIRSEFHINIFAACHLIDEWNATGNMMI